MASIEKSRALKYLSEEVVAALPLYAFMRCGLCDQTIHCSQRNTVSLTETPVSSKDIDQ